jgi:SAM-dependent methyltransferase
VNYLERLFRATEEENRRQILRLLPRARGGSLLDIGTHDGAFAVRVRERLGSERSVGVEFIDEHAERARERGFEILAADLEDGLPLADAEFDVVHANQVIEHVRHTDVFVREVRRVLRPGGIACISTNNLASWHNVFSLALGHQPTPAHVSDEWIVGNPLDPWKGRPHPDAGRPHLRLFTGRALRELCERHGLEADVVRTAGYYPLPPRVARAAARIDALHGAFLIGLFRARAG